MSEQPDLILPSDAARMFFVSPSMVYHWVKKGRVKKHFSGKQGRWPEYFVSISEIESIKGFYRDHLEAKYPDLISRNEAAKLIGVSPNMITYYAKHGHLTKHYVLENNRHYLLEREQVLAQPQRIEDMYRDPERLANLRRHALNQPKVGSLFVKRTD